MIVNGYTIAQQEILADGELRDIAFEADSVQQLDCPPNSPFLTHEPGFCRRGWQTDPLPSAAPSGVLPG